MTRRARRGLLAAGALAALAALAAGCRGSDAAADGAGRRAFRPLQPGDAAPEYAARALNGDSLSLASLRGQVVVLNVWATWCIPCRREMPMLDSLARANRERGLRVIGVSIDAGDADAKVQEFLTEHRIGFDILRDPKSVVTMRFATRGVPETFLIDRTGHVARHWLGGVDTPAAGIGPEIERALR